MNIHNNPIYVGAFEITHVVQCSPKEHLYTNSYSQFLSLICGNRFITVHPGSPHNIQIFQFNTCAT